VPRDRIRPGLRLSVHGRYNIYFRIVGEETVIYRILHSARLLTPTAFDEENPQG
jgi:plasmid stabilization system protein ParE